MCGIAGYVGHADRDILRAMCDAIAHRGPDDEGYWLAEGVGLGHRRLSIIDLAGGHQPMSNETGDVWIIFNGEIYNHGELREALERKGHRFTTRSDTECILHLYEDHGEGCVEFLRGMFAFAVWDSRKQALYCARDRLGIKPLYYTWANGTLFFASEIKSLLTCPGVSRELSPAAFHKYLAFRYVPGPETIYRGINSLQPGHSLVYADGELSTKRYWSIEDISRAELSEENALAAVRDTLSDVVRMRMMADVPVGAYLSGGVDSSLIAALMAHFSDTGLTTLSVTFDDPRHDEGKYASLVAARLGTRHHTLLAEKGSLALLSRAIWHLDQPVADAAALPVYQMAELTRRHLKVVLSGEGGDECFAGYPQLKLYRALQSLGRCLPGCLPNRVADAMPEGWSARRTLRALATCADPVAFVLEFAAHFDRGERQSMCGPAVLENIADHEAELQQLVADRMGSGSRFDRLLKFYINVWLPDDLLLKNDRMTMAHGVEARVPYLDHKLVEMAFSLPASMKIRGRTDKYLLRRIAGELLPKEIATRKKKGFTVPLEEWLDADHSGDHVHLHRELTETGLVNPHAWERVLARHGGNLFQRRRRRTLWFFKQWHRLQMS